jgi:hypothetical protein
MSNLLRDDNGSVSQVVSFAEPAHRSVQISGSAVNLTVVRPVANRTTIVIHALASNTADVFIGFDDTVTALHNGGTGGIPLGAGTSVSIDIAPSSYDVLRDVYAIVGSGTQELRIWEL